jgi:hypothetical protein
MLFSRRRRYVVCKEVRYNKLPAEERQVLEALLQRAAQKASVFQAGDEWAFLLWGGGGGRTAVVFALLLNPSFDGFTLTSWAT